MHVKRSLIKILEIGQTLVKNNKLNVAIWILTILQNKCLIESLFSIIFQNEKTIESTKLNNKHILLSLWDGLVCLGCSISGS
jgi:hypothetical protein